MLHSIRRGIPACGAGESGFHARVARRARAAHRADHPRAARPVGEQGSIDLVKGLAHSLPVIVIAEMLELRREIATSSPLVA